MSNRKPWIISCLVGIAALIATLTVFFVSWAETDAIHPSTWASFVFRVVSFPLFTVLPARTANTYFWHLGFLNCFLLATIAAFLTWSWICRRMSADG
jgi:hypothetical protein